MKKKPKQRLPKNHYCKYGMDKNKLKEFIESVAEIQVKVPKKEPGIRQSDEDVDIVRVGNEWLPINAKSNPTLGFKFIKLKDTTRECQLGCGDQVINQVVERRLAMTPVKHWRTRCNNCGCYVSPDGIGFIEGGHQVAAAYMRYFNKQGFEDSVTEITTNDSIIRIYK
jgi:hypothetical protein